MSASRLAAAARAAAATLSTGTLIACADGCPMRAGNPPSPAAAASGCPMRAGNQPEKKSGGGCPLRFGGKKAELNATNNMPATAQQARAPGQARALSTAREASSIPDGAERPWEYPSPQMFWNALVRKGKAAGAQEEDMDTVVKVHNATNELTWQKILEWERLRGGPPPRLLRFTGRPDEYSPRARLRMALGSEAPFDRHDWVVARGEDECRYVVDYYSDESREDKVPEDKSDHGAVASIVVDARPALDSLEAAAHRLWAMPLARYRGAASPAVPLLPGKGGPSSLSVSEVKGLNNAIGSKCSERFRALGACGEDEKVCADAAIALQHCIATVVCPREAETFRAAAVAAATDPEAADRAYAAMDGALDSFQREAEIALARRETRRAQR